MQNNITFLSTQVHIESAYYIIEKRKNVVLCFLKIFFTQKNENVYYFFVSTNVYST